MTFDHLDLFTLLLLGYLLILGPILGLREIAGLRRKLEEGISSARMTTYRQILWMEWGLTSLFAAGWLVLGRTPAEMGLRFTMTGPQGIAVAVAVAVTILLALYFHRASRDPKSLEELRSQLGSLRLIAPHTTAELRRFVWVSITAGICEEILYRGLLMTALAARTGLWPAVLLSSIVFGIGHAYQGSTGMLRTGLVGLFLALVVVFTGSLTTAILMHAVLDVVQGRFVWKAIRDGDTRSNYVEAPASGSA